MGIRRMVAMLAMAVVVLSTAFVPAAQGGADWWDGTWNTTHKFGSPTLHLKEDGNEVTGVYKNEAGVRIGRIWGELAERKTIFAGRYKDDAGGKGKFSITLQSDKVSFKGWFKSCGIVLCSEKYKWTGEHA